jgi:phosphoglycolate phosphatase-like HAD superfamily hydrolase
VKPLLFETVSGVTPSDAGFEPLPGLVPRPQITHVIFDFDGTLSWLRHGWPEIMCSLFRRYVPLLPGESPEKLQELLTRDILSLNGKASIFQMRKCVERAAERGGAKIDPEALLVEYLERLDEAIEERTNRILGGKAQRDDFVIHGARALLEKLRERGLTLIILSGTAEPRVKEEAELLALAPYFGTHIYGGTSNPAQSSKRAVLERLLREEKFEGKALLSLGDGPVEIQLAKEAGGLAVGVASDENLNGSGVMDPMKREQLRAAGADLLIPDYREPDALLACLLGK